MKYKYTKVRLLPAAFMLMLCCLFVWACEGESGTKSGGETGSGATANVATYSVGARTAYAMHVETAWNDLENQVQMLYKWTRSQGMFFAGAPLLEVQSSDDTGVSGKLYFPVSDVRGKAEYEGFSMDKAPEKTSLPAGDYVSAYYQGTNFSYVKLLKRIKNWAGENDMRLDLEKTFLLIENVSYQSGEQYKKMRCLVRAEKMDSSDNADSQ